MATSTTNIILQQFNQTIDTWIATLDKYTLETLCRKPTPDTWSLGQVYVHIIDDTSWFVEQVKQAASQDEHREQPMHPDGQFILQHGFPDALITGPSTNDSVPQPATKEAIEEGLARIKAEINQLCKDVSLEQFAGKTKHPGLGWFTALEWLRFADRHMQHHFRQKKGLKKN